MASILDSDLFFVLFRRRTNLYRKFTEKNYKKTSCLRKLHSWMHFNDYKSQIQRVCIQTRKSLQKKCQYINNGVDAYYRLHQKIMEILLRTKITKLFQRYQWIRVLGHMVYLVFQWRVKNHLQIFPRRTDAILTVRQYLEGPRISTTENVFLF